MLVDFSYDGVFIDIFLSQGVVIAYLFLFGYRILASSVFPRICKWYCYCLFFLLGAVMFRLLPAFGATSFWEGAAYFFSLTVPSIVAGMIEIVRKCRWRTVLISCAIEMLLFPIWFDIVLLTVLFFDTTD